MKFLQSKVFIASVIVVVAAIGFYFWFTLSSGGINIDIGAEGEKRIGQTFDLKVSFNNDSNNVLNDLSLTLEAPDGIVVIDGGDRKIIEREVGSIDIGGVHQETFKVMATPTANSNREFIVKLSYSPGSIAAHFEKTKSFSTEIKNLESELSLVAPEKVFSGEEFEITGDYKYEQFPDLPKASLKITYPKEFSKTSEEIMDKTGGVGEFISKGKVNFPDDASFEIKAELILNLLGKDYAISEKVARVLISPSPLSLRILLNGSANFVAHPSDTLDYNLIFKNNTDVPLQDIVLKAKLTGEMFDFGSLDPRNAKFNPSTRTVTWDSAQFQELALLNAGEERSASFSVKLRTNYPIKKLNDKNFSIKAEVNIESPTVPFLVSADKTVNSASLVTLVGGKIEVDAKALFRDATSGILNKGPWPPKVGMPTQYTVHWLLTNYASDVRDIEVRAALEDGVTFTGVIKSNTTTAPTLDLESGQIVWKIDKLVATTGITGKKPEAIFQIEAIPTADKRGNYMSLLSPTQVKALDEFTNTEIVGTDVGLTTRLIDDPTVSEGQGFIVE